MSIFQFFSSPDINQGVNECRATAGAVLVDVREKDEYRSGHIAGSKNVPLSQIQNAKGLLPNKEAPLFVYCLSGARSTEAVRHLKQAGYTNVKNIGGISAYKGKVVR